MQLAYSTKYLIKNRKLFPRRIIIQPITFLLAVGMLLLTTNLFAAVSADKIKAAYIYQLTQFVTWPNIHSSANTVLTICVLGKEPISSELEPLNERKMGGQLIKVSHPKAIKDTTDCNILYIAKTEQRRLKAILKNLRTKPTLTISSIPGFTANGGIIGFIIIDNKVRLEINRAPARHAGIKLSAKLLEIASTVRNDTPGEGQP